MALLKEQNHPGTLLTSQPDPPAVDLDLVKEDLTEDNNYLLKRIGKFVADANKQIEGATDKASVEAINKTLRDEILWITQGDALLDSMIE